MTDTAAREEARERVRAYVEAMDGAPDHWRIDHAYKHSRAAALELNLQDLRLLLSGGEGGRHLAKDALPRGETHPDTPSQPSAPEFSTENGLSGEGFGDPYPVPCDRGPLGGTAA